MTAPWRVYIRDPQLRRVGLLEDYTSLTLTQRFNDVSTFQLVMSGRSGWAQTFGQAGYGIQVYRGSALVTSGSWSKFGYIWDENTDEVTISGGDDTVWMKYRLAHPQPTSTPDGTGGVFTTVLEDSPSAMAASELIAYYGRRNVGSLADAARKIATSTSVPSPYGASLTQRARWQNLLTLCQEIATAGAVDGIEPGFRIVNTGGTFILRVYQPVDRSASVKFSPALGNVRRIEYEGTAPEVTVAYVGDQGEGTGRHYLVRSSSELGAWGRREAELVNANFDPSSLTLFTDMSVEASKALVDKGFKHSLSVTPIDLPGMQYGIDYSVGDKVAAVINGLGPGQALTPHGSVSDVLREATIKITADGAEVAATVGSNGVGLRQLKIFDRLRNLATRVTNVERT